MKTTKKNLWSSTIHEHSEPPFDASNQSYNLLMMKVVNYFTRSRFHFTEIIIDLMNPIGQHVQS